ncbi:MAG: hypothetical protein WBF17_23745 [Phycisphaerae bacterium]
MNRRSRRSFLATAAAAPIAAASSLSLANSGTGAARKMGSKSFYKGDGSFDPEAAKKAYYDMMKAFNYPIHDVLKTDQFWVCDFLQRDMAKLGMGGIFWINESNTYAGSGAKAYKGEFKDDRFGYLGHEIYLLPGQMLPEHNHIGGPEGHGPKMEAWHIRYGSVTFFGEYKGAGDEIEIAQMPAKERPWGCGEKWFKSKYAARRTAGQMYKLVDPESWHFQRAGARGAIVSEYATYHNHVQFSKPGMKFDSSKPKTS